MLRVIDTAQNSKHVKYNTVKLKCLSLNVKLNYQAATWAKKSNSFVSICTYFVCIHYQPCQD
jgi:hypothetical protein